MPPKRKRAEADTAAESSTARTTRKSTRKIVRAKNNAAEATDMAGASSSKEPPPKKTRAKGKTSNATNSRTKGRKTAPRVLGADDEPLNSTTDQQQSDDDLDMPVQAPSVVPTRIEYTKQGALALFKRFADDDNPDVIGPGGVEKLCTEAGIPLEGAQPLIFAWQFKAQEMAKVTRAEWVQGTEALRISSLPVLAMAMKEFDDLVVHDRESIIPVSSSSSVKKRNAVNCYEPYNRARYLQYASARSAAFTELYQFCFSLSKSSQSRNLDMETVIALWSVLLVPRYPIVTELNEFLSQSGSYKGANKDIWNMVHEFCQTIDKEFSNYEADGAWPTMLDDFVMWKREKTTSSTDDAPR